MEILIAGKLSKFKTSLETDGTDLRSPDRALNRKFKIETVPRRYGGNVSEIRAKLVQ